MCNSNTPPDSLLETILSQLHSANISKHFCVYFLCKTLKKSQNKKKSQQKHKTSSYTPTLLTYVQKVVGNQRDEDLYCPQSQHLFKVRPLWEIWVHCAAGCQQHKNLIMQRTNTRGCIDTARWGEGISAQQ